MKKGRKASKAENIWNVPNALSFIRILLTFVIIYFIFAGFKILPIAIIFAIAAFTDFLDGQIARRFHLKTEFGRKMDIIADRFLMLGVAAAVLIDFGIKGQLTEWYGLQVLMILSREIIAFPFALAAILMGWPIPHSRFIGKLTTFLQGFAFPLILLNMLYQNYEFSIYLAVPTFVVGIISGLTYIKDLNGGKGRKK